VPGGPRPGGRPRSLLTRAGPCRTVVTGPANRRGGALGGGDRGSTPVGLGFASSADVGRRRPGRPPKSLAHGGRTPMLRLGGLVRTTQVVPRPPALPSRRRSARHAPRQQPPRAAGTWPIRPGVDGPDRLPRFGASLCGKAKLFGKAHASRNAGGSDHRATPTPLEATWPHCSWCSRWPTPC
jgi:hypothetical protein